jgi:hypothetical protein
MAMKHYAMNLFKKVMVMKNKTMILFKENYADEALIVKSFISSLLSTPPIHAEIST